MRSGGKSWLSYFHCASSSLRRNSSGSGSSRFFVLGIVDLGRGILRLREIIFSRTVYEMTREVEPANPYNAFDRKLKPVVQVFPAEKFSRAVYAVEAGRRVFIWEITAFGVFVPGVRTIYPHDARFMERQRRWSVALSKQDSPDRSNQFFQHPSLHFQFSSWRGSFSKIHFAIARFPSYV